MSTIIETPVQNHPEYGKSLMVTEFCDDGRVNQWVKWEKWEKWEKCGFMKINPKDSMEIDSKPLRQHLKENNHLSHASKNIGQKMKDRRDEGKSAE